MKLRFLFPLVLLFLFALWAWIPPVRGQEEHHGADSSFQLRNLVILWGILKGPDEDRSWVCIKIIRTGSEPGPWTSYRLETMDAFSQFFAEIAPNTDRIAMNRHYESSVSWKSPGCADVP